MIAYQHQLPRYNRRPNGPRCNGVIILTLLLLIAPVLFAQAQQGTATATPTLVTIKFAQQLYCGARWINPTVQLYCYNSSPGHTWDQLIENRIFNPSLYPAGVSNVFSWPGDTFSIVWIFHRNRLTGTTDWDLAWNDPQPHDQMGSFQ